MLATARMTALRLHAALEQGEILEPSKMVSSAGDDPAEAPTETLNQPLNRAPRQLLQFEGSLVPPDARATRG
jgi:hypothetical protein